MEKHTFHPKICVVGAGYVGLSLAVLLAQLYDVTIIDILETKIDLINKRVSPIKDELLESFLQKKALSLKATTNDRDVYRETDYVIVSTPTNYDETTKSFDTRSIESVISNVLKENTQAIIIIKSTVPVGFTKRISLLFGSNRIIFSPEFLRESYSLYDNLYPSRIIAGIANNNEEQRNIAHDFLKILLSISNNPSTICLTIGSSEAESVKLFSNTYLALRVAFFNELDTYAEMNNLDSESIINGVSLDPRIGNHYNNPSFGYGGYCLPKDTKQLKSDFNDIPEKLISAVIASNEERKQFIADRIISFLYERNHNGTVGVFRLLMKSKSDNFRNSAIMDIVDILINRGISVIIYEPLYNSSTSNPNYKIIKELPVFLQTSDIIIANRFDICLNPVIDKVYTRDIFFKD